MATPQPTYPSPVELSAADLSRHCPRVDAPIRKFRPHFFLGTAHAGEAVCPYCSTRHLLKCATRTEAGH